MISETPPGPGAFRRPHLTGSRGGRSRDRRPFPLRPLLFIAAIVLVIIVFGAGARRITDWLWYREIGLERVFFLKVTAQWIFGGATGLVALAILGVNARASRIDPLIAVEGRPGPVTDLRILFVTHVAPRLGWPMVAGLSLIIGLVAAAFWRTAIQFWYRTPFGVTDPVFNRDIGFYVFTVPAIDIALGLIGLILFVALVFFTLPMHLMRGGFSRRGVLFEADPAAARHLAVLIAAFLIVRALGILFVDVPDTLQANHAVIQGATYTDLRVRVPMQQVLGVLTLAFSGFVLWRAWRGRLINGVVWIVGVYVAANVVLLGLIPSAYQRLVVQPNELAREAPQIRHYIAASRAAWGIDSVQRRELNPNAPLTWRDIEANRATIDNIRLWDRNELLQTFGQIQAIRTYYDFVAVDDDRYTVGGRLRQVLLSPRELNVSALPTRTFINEHLTYTHGMGVTLGPANEVTPEGLPQLWVQDLPPKSVPGLEITRPQIYFGEQSNDFVLVPSRQREFDYPTERDSAAYSSYAGKAGISIASFARRLLFAVRFGSMNVMLSSDMTPETRVLLYRNVATRASLALPFLRFDADPYLVITAEGGLVWILDAYTVTDRYPYAHRLSDGTSYMRNSVKVTIDAYDGTISAYLSDPGDPMIRTLSKIYPGTLKPIDQMPADLRAHVRYPEDLFQVQTMLYATFHMTDPETFYHREDQWQVPGTNPNDPDAPQSALIRHMVMRLPGEATPEFIVMRPFTPRQKDNLAAWMVARNDGANYGKLLVYSFPRQSLVFGPRQIASRISQDTDVSREVSLWDQRGSRVIHGEMLVIPVEHSLIYVKPLYLQAQGGRIPELKRVVVVRENQVVMAETLEGALRQLFGQGGAPRIAAAPDSATPVDRSVADLVRAANSHFERARAAQRSDDWATYGEEMRKLGEVLRRLGLPPR